MQQGAGAPPETPAIGENLRPPQPASPISSWPPQGAAAPRNSPDEEMGERLAGGNRWPRQETIALIQIRSEMDAAFRDASPKGPLWDDVSRKMAALGYRRSAKKCKEKFENVNKYYKRSKEGRGARADGKSYHFFDQLEPLFGVASTTTTTTTPPPPAPAYYLAPPPPSTTTPSAPAPAYFLAPPPPATTTVVAPNSLPVPIATPPAPPLPIPPTTGASISSNTSSSSASDSSSDSARHTGRKRKRRSGGGNRKMITIFEGMMRQMMQRQDTMQKQFLELIEKREEDRIAREEAWRRQEMARHAREHELLAHDRAAAASRDAAVLAFLHNLTGQRIQLPPPILIHTPPPPPPPPQVQPTPPPQPPQQQQPPSSESAFELSGSRWPKVEIHALIQIRSSMEARYQEGSPKWPLWEEVSTEMGRLGYSRNAKRCKEKWENINKYYKKVKESSRQRPQDAKTCPYFHQLDALYRQNILGGGGGGYVVAQPHQLEQQETNQTINPIPNSQGSGGSTNGEDGHSTGGASLAGGEGTGGSSAVTKPGDNIVKETMKPSKMEAPMDDYDRMEDLESEDDDEEDDEEDEDGNTQYRVELQRPNASGGAAPATSGSFLAMV